MAGDYVRRTAITRLRVSREQQDLLEATIAEWQRGCQIATDTAWGQCETAHDVQSLAYDTVREQTELGSQHAVLATHQAAQAISGCVERRAEGKRASKPTFTAPTVTYDSRTMTLFDDETVSLATIGGRVRCPLVLADEDGSYQQQYLESERWSVTESTLTAEDGDVLLHLGFRRQKTEEERTDDTAGNGTVLGVDLGVENVAVTSTARFFSGRKLRHTLREFEKVRGGLQQTGTRSAHRTLQAASGRQLRHLRERMHEVSNGLVAEAIAHDCDTIAFERLSGIRERTDGAWGHEWAFAVLYEQVEYKAEVSGISVRQVDPAHTSTRCCECGSTADENRPARVVFRCRDCGSEANADYNAAKNVGLRCVRRGQQSSRRTGDSRLALKSGTVTPSGEFVPHPEGSEAEFTDKSDHRCRQTTGRDPIG